MTLLVTGTTDSVAPAPSQGQNTEPPLIDSAETGLVQLDEIPVPDGDL
jgi:hypothetical protein